MRCAKSGAPRHSPDGANGLAVVLSILMPSGNAAESVMLPH